MYTDMYVPLTMTNLESLLFTGIVMPIHNTQHKHYVRTICMYGPSQYKHFWNSRTDAARLVRVPILICS